MVEEAKMSGWCSRQPALGVESGQSLYVLRGEFGRISGERRGRVHRASCADIGHLRAGAIPSGPAVHRGDNKYGRDRSPCRHAPGNDNAGN